MRPAQTWMFLGLLWGCGGAPEPAAPAEASPPGEERQVRASTALTAWIEGCYYVGFNTVQCTGGVSGGVTPYTYNWLLNHTSWTQGSLYQNFYCPKQCEISFGVRDAALAWGEDAPVLCDRLTHTCNWVSPP